MSVHHMCAWYLWMSEEGTESPGSEITDGCEPLYKHWKQPKSRTDCLLSSINLYDLK